MIYVNRYVSYDIDVKNEPVVGSSKNKILGFAANSTPIETRFFYSKLIPPLKISPTYAIVKILTQVIIEP
jgi:hypothetical protein